MPRYFFETDDEDVTVFDEDGSEHADDEAARAEAVSALPDMAREKMPGGDRRTFTVSVFNDERDLIYKGVMRFEGRWASRGAALAPDSPAR